MVPMSSAPDPTERPDPDPASTSRPRAPSPAPSPSHPDPAMPAPAPRLSDGPGRLGAEGMRPVSARLISSRYVAGIPGYVIGLAMVIAAIVLTADRKSTRLNSSHVATSYAVFCLNKDI